MAKKNTKITTVISLRALCTKANMDHMKVYNNLNDNYNSLQHHEKVQLVNTLYDELTPMLKRLGFYIELKRIKDPK